MPPLSTTAELGQAVRAERTRRQMSQADLAGRIGTTLEWVGRLESGAPRLELDKVLSATAALGIGLVSYRDLATERDKARADSIAANMGLESQYLTPAACADILDGIVRRRLARAAAV